MASAKGGCGKTTLAILIGAELALDGYRVALLDCDLNQHASAFGVKADIPASGSCRRWTSRTSWPR
jgi:chromosome partitioning protein